MKKILVLVTLTILIGIFSINDVFAASQVTITPVPGSSSPGCETSGGCYSPSTATVDVGGTVIFSNTDTAAHTFTAGTAANGPSGVFDSSLVIAGSSYEWKPTTAGQFPYNCLVHPWMSGLIIVKEVSSSSSSGTMTVTGTSATVNYKITGGKIYRIAPDVEAHSLIISISTSQDGSLSITLPRSLIDAKMGSQDDRFFILINGEEVDFEETATSSSRTVTIAFPSKTNEIEIIGTIVNGGYTSTPTPIPLRAPSGTDITIGIGSSSPGCERSNTCYIPYRYSTQTGDTVMWFNSDSAAHTITSGTAGSGSSGVFDSSLITSGQTYSHTFNSAGTYTYYCMVHPWMAGMIVVQSNTTYQSPTSYSGAIAVTGTDFTANYKITGGKLLSITPDVSARSLIISISAIQDGSLSITLPRSLIDAKSGNSDAVFFILVDGEEIRISESKSSSSRTLTISFPAGAEEIEVIGTTVNGGSTYTPTPTIPSSANIVIPSGTSSPGCETSSSCYQPYQFSSGKGSTITWFNADTAAHTVTSGTPGNGPDGEFDSSLLLSGSSFSHKFNNDGTYPYYCMVHPWMAGYVIIQRSGAIIPPPTPTPVPTPIPTPTTDRISVSTNSNQYSPGELVTVKIFTSQSTNVAVSVIGPSGDNIVSRTVSTDSSGYGSLQFKLPESSQNGSYRVDSTATISGKVSDSTTFTVKSTSRVSIVSLQPTDQQGNAISSFTKGKLGFVKVILNSDSNVSSLVTINLFDSDLTSLGIGSFKTTLSSGQSEMTLSFFIPNDAKTGNGDIYANVFSDWPSQGGVPLTGESTTQVRIQ